MPTRVKKKKSKSTESANGLLPGEHVDILKDVHGLVPDADHWLDTPNVHFEGNTRAKQSARTANGSCNILRSVKYGSVS